MRTGLLAILLCSICVGLAGSVRSQVNEDLMSEVLTSLPGKDRVKRLIQLSVDQRKAGRYKEAIELAILGTSEAEKNNMDKELARGLLELAAAHMAKGEMDRAIGACMRASMVNGTYHSGVRTEALIQLAELYTSVGYPQKALEHLEDANDAPASRTMFRGRYIVAEASARSLVMQPEPLVKYCDRLLDEVLAITDKQIQLSFFSIMASAQARAGQNAAALKTEDRVMKLAIALDKSFEAGISANNLGELYCRVGNNKEALNAFTKGLIMVEDIPYLRLSMQINAAHVQAKSGNHTVAVRMITEALTMSGQPKLKRLMPRVLRTMAAIQLVQGETSAAQSTGLEALDVAEAQNELAEQAAACNLLVNIFEAKDLPTEARVYANKGRDIEQKMNAALVQSKTDKEAQLLRLQRVEREQADLLNREERKEGRLRQMAMDAENREKRISILLYEKQLEESGRREAQLAHLQVDNQLRLAQAALESERQERMIQDLDNSRMLQSLNLTKLGYEQKEQQRAMELLEKRNELVEQQSRTMEAQRLRDRDQKRFSLLLAAGAILLSVFMAWAWIQARRKKRTIWTQNQHIKGINDELQHKNKNIESSLTYAQTIQSAILVTEEDLQGVLPESFLMYKPLDIVSGDLPFMKRVGNRVFVAAIDCTGHGVPAAMMTFIAYYGLSELIALHHHETCGQILDRLHEHVKRTMDSRGEKHLYNDGFDIGLCAIDLDQGKLSFAGAQLPLVLIRGDELTRIKGDVLPLGDDHFKRRKGYDNHAIDLVTGDRLYLFSDGIIHQFGGDTGKKKFSMRQLTDLLSRTAGMDLSVVKQQTEELFAEWQGETAQTDDVLLIGMRYAA